MSIPFVNIIALPFTMGIGWGKDYWSIFLKTNDKILATDTIVDKWFSDIDKKDANTKI